MSNDPAVRYRVESAEVLYADEAVTAVDRSAVQRLKQRSLETPRRRIRLCAHPASDHRLHEMLIVHERGVYVRPHKHPGKMESTHIIEGLVDVVLFDDTGQVTRVIAMGAFGSGLVFYHRTAFPMFHTLLVRSEQLVFHETTEGPFRRADTVFAPWAPAEEEPESVISYIAALQWRIEGI